MNKFLLSRVLFAILNLCLTLKEKALKENNSISNLSFIQGLERDSVANTTNTSSSYYPMLGITSRIDEVWNDWSWSINFVSLGCIESHDEYG